MTNFMSRWLKPASYESLSWLNSETFAGVSFGLKKMSLAQRIDLSSRVRELTAKNEFLKAGDVADGIEVALSQMLVKKLYLEWAVIELRGLRIDGKPASLEALINKGPEPLVNEIAAAVQSQMELSETERKNS